MREFETRLASPPDGGLFRVGRWPDPFEWPPRPQPLPANAGPVETGNRFDDPLGEFTTLYLASSPVAAFGETISKFRETPELLDRLDEFLTGDAETPEHEPPLLPGAIPDDYFSNRTLGHLQTHVVPYWIDLPDQHTLDYLNAVLTELKNEKQIDPITKNTLRLPDRSITRPIAKELYDRAEENDPARAVYCGLSYESSHVVEWRCWALWDVLPSLPGEETSHPITRDNKDLLEAAQILGLTLPL